MASLSAFVAAVSLLVGGGSATAASDPQLTLSFTGRGWGHGVGMSQWGAYGFARQGSTYDRILAHYYQGTQLGKTPGARIRALVVEEAGSMLIGSLDPFVVEDAAGERVELPAASYRLDPKLELDGRQLAPPLTFRPQGSPLLVNGSGYRGTVDVMLAGKRLNAVNTLPLEEYLRGVVPREVPANWPAEALKAQAVAARSYAVATKKSGGAFDVYDDTRSQVYGGIDAEQPTTTEAIRATARQVLLYEGRVATTYFFSTSGGRTADVAEAWPGSQPVPYLVSVPDPYDSASPVHRWGPVGVTGAKLKKTLKLAALPVDARVRTSRSGRASQLVLTLADGSEVAVVAGTVRTAFALRSTWFRVGRLALRPPTKLPAVFGSKVRLTGFVRGVSNVSLERRLPGGGWERATRVAKGDFAVPLRVEQTAHYRLTAGGVLGAVVKVAVAPRVTMNEPLRGTVRPVWNGAVVEVQRQEGRRWVSFTTTTLDDAGRFDAGPDAPPGTYRARFAPRGGFAVGFSRPLTVS